MRNGITGLHFGITSDIIRNGGILERWVVESILSGISDSNIDACYLKHLVEAITPLYSCNRPPGAAGALIKLRDRIVYGWVGPTNHSPSCNTVGCEIDDGHCVRNIHAEVQAIARAARRGMSTEHATIYSILKPCYDCTKVIIHAGIVEIFYAGVAYDEERTNEILRSAGIMNGVNYIDIGLEYGNG
jgi:dCMP deaminase